MTHRIIQFWILTIHNEIGTCYPSQIMSAVLCMSAMPMILIFMRGTGGELSLCPAPLSPLLRSSSQTNHGKMQIVLHYHSQHSSHAGGYTLVWYKDSLFK